VNFVMINHVVSFSGCILFFSLKWTVIISKQNKTKQKL